MHRFEVWAPGRQRVRLQADGRIYPMQGPSDRGYWSAEVEAAAPGTRYGYLLDDDPQPYPDPRSLSQPHGVHGLSQLYDHAAFAWSDASWQSPPLASAILYELHLGTFTPLGTLDAAIERLDYLRQLGISHVELMPVVEFAGNHGWGYDGVDLFAVHHAYGGPDALKRFVDACHQRGLAVLIDVVYNHFGPVGNYNGKFGPYTTERHHTPWGGAINFEDQGSDEVRRFFLDNATMWLRDFHADGLRLDAVHEIVDRSATHFLETLGAEVERLSAVLGRSLALIAESDLNDPRMVTPREAHGYGMDAQWSDDFHHALFTVLHAEHGGYYDDFGQMAQLARAIEHAFVYDGRYSVYRQRSHGRPVEGISAHRFVVCIQNHDQVGNRAVGDRVAQIAGLARAQCALGLLLTSPYVPLLFQGEEFAASSPFLFFADHEDPEMARLVDAGRKREFAAFGWDESQIPSPEDAETFHRSRLPWDELREHEHAAMLDWTQRLIRLRRSTPALNDGDLHRLRVSYDEAAGWLRMEREAQHGGAVVVLLNLGSQEAEFEVGSDVQLELASHPQARLVEGCAFVPPDSVAILLPS